MKNGRVLECSFLIPIKRDSDRNPHRLSTWRLLKEALWREFGGWTGPKQVCVLRSVESMPGGWLPDRADEPIEDESKLYRVAVLESRIDGLRALLRRAANTFDQQAIYLSVRGYVEYVEPTPEDGYLE